MALGSIAKTIPIVSLLVLAASLSGCDGSGEAACTVKSSCDARVRRCSCGHCPQPGIGEVPLEDTKGCHGPRPYSLGDPDSGGCTCLKCCDGKSCCGGRSPETRCSIPCKLCDGTQGDQGCHSGFFVIFSFWFLFFFRAFLRFLRDTSSSFSKTKKAKRSLKDPNGEYT